MYELLAMYCAISGAVEMTAIAIAFHYLARSIGKFSFNEYNYVITKVISGYIALAFVVVCDCFDVRYDTEGTMFFVVPFNVLFLVIGIAVSVKIK